MRLEIGEEIEAAGPLRVPPEQDEEQGCRVDRPEIGCLRNLVEIRHFADAQLVHDLARLLVAPRVVMRSLE